MVRGPNAMLAAALERAQPVAVTTSELTLSFPPDAAFLKRKAEQDDYRKAAAEALRNITGQSLILRFELGEAPAATNGADHEAPDPVVSDDDLVRRIVEEFNAEELEHTDPES
jgi:hypothetical protein